MSETIITKRKRRGGRSETVNRESCRRRAKSPATNPVDYFHGGHGSPPLPRPISQEFRERFPTLVFDVPIEIRKPADNDYFQRHPDPDYSHKFRLLHMKDLNEYYLVDKSLHASLMAELQVFDLVTCVTRAGTVFLWPVRLSDRRGNKDVWVLAMRQALDIADGHWVRMVSRPGENGYEVRESKYADPPQFPAMTFQELVNLAFRDFQIHDLDHPVVKMLQGRD